MQDPPAHPIVVQASRLHDSTYFEEARAGRPHNKGRGRVQHRYNAYAKETQ